MRGSWRRGEEGREPSLGRAGRSMSSLRAGGPTPPAALGDPSRPQRRTARRRRWPSAQLGLLPTW